VNRTAEQTDPEMAARLRLVIMRLARRLRQQAPAGATPSQLSVLATLASKGPMTLGSLAEAERVRPPTMTRIVVALEEEELVGREQDPDDRRRTTVRLTDRGRRSVAAARTRKTAYLAERIASLDANDRETLRKASEVLERMLEDEA
jgi:DNA-binding MarR family transcriptional regulator